MATLWGAPYRVRGGDWQGVFGAQPFWAKGVFGAQPFWANGVFGRKRDSRVRNSGVWGHNGVGLKDDDRKRPAE